MDDAPLLIADVPWLLYRAFFALPKSIKGADGRAGERAAGHRQRAAGGKRSATAARGGRAASAPRRRAIASRLYPALPRPPRRRCRRSLREQWERAPELLASFGWTIADADELEADDAMGSFARVEAECKGACSVVDQRTAIYTSASSEQSGCFGFGKGRGVLCLGTEPGARSLRRRTGPGARFHRPARRPLRRACPGRPASGEDGS